MSTVLNLGKDIVDAARTDDFVRLTTDIVMARQGEDTFKTFREAGRELGLTQLLQLFVERTRVAVPSAATV